MNILEPAAFLRQNFAAFHTTGAVAPSSRFLARAMAKNLNFSSVYVSRCRHGLRPRWRQKGPVTVARKS